MQPLPPIPGAVPFQQIPYGQPQVVMVAQPDKRNNGLLAACWIFAVLSALSPLCCGLPAFIVCVIGLAQGDSRALWPLIVTILLSIVGIVLGLAMMDPTFYE